MATHTTTLASFGANVLNDVWLEKTFIKALRTKLVVHGLGKQSTLTENMGKTVTWQYFSNLAAATTALVTEGVAPATPQNFTTTPATATLAEYGHWSEFTKVLLAEALDATLEEIVEGLGHQAALTIDRLIIDELGTSASLTVDSGAALTADGLRQASAQLGSVGATAPGMVEHHPSSPGGAFYVAPVSNEAGWDLVGEGTPAWFQAKNSEIESNLRTPLQETPASAALYSCIVKVTQNIQRDTGTSPDDDLNYVIGKDAIGVASLQTDILKPRVIITRPEERRDIPLRNMGTAGWWLLFGTKAIDANRYVQLLSDATGIDV